MKQTRSITLGYLDLNHNIKKWIFFRIVRLFTRLGDVAPPPPRVRACI